MKKILALRNKNHGAFDSKVKSCERTWEFDKVIKELTLKSKKEFTRKVLALGIVVVIILMVDLHNLQPLLKESTTLDPNWNTAPGYLFLHDRLILGRDLIFTYGPLFQFFSVLGSKLHVLESSIFSLHLIYFVNESTALVLLAVCLLFVPFLGWKISVLLLILFTPAVNLRSSIIIFTITLLSYSFTVKKLKIRAMLWAFVGVAAFISQIYLFNLGLYAVALTIVVGIFFALVSWQSQKRKFLQGHQYLKPTEYLFSIGVVLAVYIVLNLILSVAFLITGENYNSLFQYQELSLSIVKGYPFFEGLPVFWVPQIKRLVLLFSGIYLFGIILAISRYRTMKVEEVYFPLAYCALAGIMLKTVLVRSDFVHFEIGLKGIYFFVLIVFGYLAAREFFGLRKIVFSGIFLLFLLLNGVYVPTNFLFDLVNFVKSPEPYKNFHLAREFYPDQDTIDRNFYLLPEAYQTEEKIVILGYRNYVPELYDMEMVAPVLQDYAIMTSALANYYIQTIEYEGYPIVLFEYADVLDGIFQGSRYPELYRFLLENYHVSSLEGINDRFGAVILEKHDAPKEVESKPLEYSIIDSNQGTTSYIFKEPIQCDILEINLSMHYPPLSSIIGTPGRIRVEYYLNNQLYQDRQYAIGSLSDDGPFITYVPTLERHDLWKIFYEGDDRVKNEYSMFDRVTFSTPLSAIDPLYVSPEYEVHSIACLD